MIKIKTGPPINAVTIPDSSSPGLPHILPRTSEISKTQAPQTADSGIIFSDRDRQVRVSGVEP